MLNRFLLLLALFSSSALGAEPDCAMCGSNPNRSPAIAISTDVISKAANPFQNICGKIDVPSTENAQLENLIFTLDLEKGSTKPRIQCGLPGEKLSICGSCEEKPSEEIMGFLRPYLAERKHVAWHEKWHLTRQNAARLTDAEIQEMQKDGWIPAQISPAEFRRVHEAGKGSGAGEDFLYMHRTMIKMNQLELAAAGLPCTAPWQNPPALEDKDWPFPKKIEDQDARDLAENTLGGFQTALATYRNPAKLRKLSLNQLGAIMEPTFHQNMHNFYRGSPACSKEAKRDGYCDDLVPVNTSPLNKHFWKIHGMLDLLVGDWLKANSYEEIAVSCAGKKRCYEWKSPWIGKAPGAS